MVELVRVRWAALLGVLLVLGASVQDAELAKESGVARIHVAVLPPTLNLTLGSSSSGRGIHAAIHESLIRRNAETLELEPSLCREFVVEDSLVLVPSGAAREAFAVELSGVEAGSSRLVVFGKVTEEEGGYRVTPRSEGNPLQEAVFIPMARVQAVERGTVFTLRLREDVLWHDGHGFDAGDVLFSWQLYSNPHVHCDSRRFQYQKITDAELLGSHGVRFFYEGQYFKSIEALASLCLLPSHLYDLRDPDHERHDSDADEVSLASEINENAHNREWVGLGPYRVLEWGAQWIRAQKFAGYYDSSRAGHLGEVWWRSLTSDTVLREALSEGILDFTDRLTPELAEELNTDEQLAERYSTGRFHQGRYGFIAWNLRLPELADQRVRRAIAHAFDFERFNASQYAGRAVRVTGPQNRLGPGYDQTVAPPEFDPERAEALLTEAGWIDRDGDGVLDLAGEDLEIELLLPAGNKPGLLVATVLQEELEPLGLRLIIQQLDIAALLGRVRARDFEAVLLAWTQPLESDPEQKWHSSNAENSGSSNFGGLDDPDVDELIRRGQAELNRATRFEIWRKLHRRLDELQPYLFLYDAPSTYALHSEIGGFRSSPVPPNYDVREWVRH